MRLLCLSNGHGEDVIALKILEQLRDSYSVSALPLVGEGYAYRKAEIPIIGTVQKMPSGGFIYMDNQQLWRDLQGGLIGLTIKQLQAIRQWVRDNEDGKILAVGDIFPLVLAWLSGASYAFVGTAKSEFYLRDEDGWLGKTSWLERYWGSVYLPWERWLMIRPGCLAVFPRDSLTTETLQQWSIPAFDLGNPMMDGIIPEAIVEGEKQEQKLGYGEKMVILLLPGSRAPEAEENWRKIMTAVSEIQDSFADFSLHFLAAIAPSLSLANFQEFLFHNRWQTIPTPDQLISTQDPDALSFTHQNSTLTLTCNAYAHCLISADVAIAMAGTATEQFVGLGKPAFTIAGNGPQFTPAFAEAQTRLLGNSIIFVEQPLEIASQLKSLINNQEQLRLIAQNGKNRMGTAGAAKRIAQHLGSTLNWLNT